MPREAYRSLRGHTDRLSIVLPLDGVWFIEIDGFTAFANLTLRVKG